MKRYVCSSFAAEHLGRLDSKQLEQLDHLLNDTDHDWQLYHWMTGL